MEISRQEIVEQNRIIFIRAAVNPVSKINILITTRLMQHIFYFHCEFRSLLPVRYDCHYCFTLHFMPYSSWYL